MSKIIATALLVGIIVFLMGALADFHDVYSRTAYALGVVTATLAYMAGHWLLEK